MATSPCLMPDAGHPGQEGEEEPYHGDLGEKEAAELAKPGL